ncbi:MAG TPA: HlyD family efflux transporter periplasmic adaptor subunit [Symbiobacteriaceae bacterium]|nr:HlyD family efflux transporter periplasmic adaptor subunit [Symbiobacteriaceae bacterium]
MPHATSRQSNLRTLRREIPPPPKKRSAGRKVLVTLLAGIALLGAAAAVYRSRPVTYETFVLTKGAVEITQAVDGLVVRREQVYTAPAAGRLQRLVPEGQRVRVGAPVAKIIAADATVTAIAPAQPVPPTQAAAPAGDSAARQEIDRLTAQIFERAAAVNDAKAKGDSELAARLQDELDQLGVRQQELTQQLGRTQPVVTPAPPLPAPEPAGPALGEITATVSGLVVYQTDGLESRLAVGQEKEWKPSFMSSLSAVPRVTGELVAKGDPVLKVVDNLTFSLVAVVPEAALKYLGDTDRVSIRFTGREGPPVAARITRQVREGSEVLLVLSAPVFPEELVHQRRFRATLLMGTYEGLVVPRTAIDVRDGLQGVWVLEGIETRFHPVRVLGGNDELLALETDLSVGVRVLQQAPTWMR